MYIFTGENFETIGKKQRKGFKKKKKTILPKGNDCYHFCIYTLFCV